MSQSLRTATPRRLRELAPSEVAAALASDPRIIVPVGSLEQHGAHLPVGCDTIIVERLADDLSASFGVLRAPTVEYGVNPPSDRVVPGIAAVRKKTLHRLLNDLVAAWELSGVDEFVLLTAHAYDPHQEALATVIAGRARVRVVDVFGVQVGDLLDGQTEAMHGDEVDTSLLLHLAPELVRMEAAQDYMVSRESLRRFRRGWSTVPADSAGSIGRPRLATAEKGRLLYERILARLAERILMAPPLDDDDVEA
jgi:creatinine amidohydrolase